MKIKGSKEQIDMNSELINELKEWKDKMNLKRCDELIAELSDYNYGKEITSIIQQMKEAEGVTEELKATQQLIWVQRMNNIRNRAEEIIKAEMIFT